MPSFGGRMLDSSGIDWVVDSRDAVKLASKAGSVFSMLFVLATRAGLDWTKSKFERQFGVLTADSGKVAVLRFFHIRNFRLLTLAKKYLYNSTMVVPL